jgi:hypothetical protein
MDPTPSEDLLRAGLSVDERRADGRAPGRLHPAAGNDPHSVILCGTGLFLVARPATLVSRKFAQNYHKLTKISRKF